MTIIELLNEISKGEQVPIRIIFRGVEWRYNKYISDYGSSYNNYYKGLFEDLFRVESARNFLNEPVEIIGD